MAIRATFITDHFDITLSNEFVEKYNDRYNFREGNKLPISSKKEIKIGFDDFEEDFETELKIQGIAYEVNAVYLTDDTNVDLVDRIKTVTFNKQ